MLTDTQQICSNSTHYNIDKLKLTHFFERAVKCYKITVYEDNWCCVIVPINACRGVKPPFMPQDIWDNFNLWSTERTGALTHTAGGL